MLAFISTPSYIADREGGRDMIWRSAEASTTLWGHGGQLRRSSATPPHSELREPGAKLSKRTVRANAQAIRCRTDRSFHPRQDCNILGLWDMHEGTYWWVWSLEVCTVTGVPREGRPKGRTVSLDRTDRQLAELSVDPWRPTFSFLVIVTQHCAALRGAMRPRSSESGAGGDGWRVSRAAAAGESRTAASSRLGGRRAAHGRSGGEDWQQEMGDGGAGAGERAGRLRTADSGQRGGVAMQSGWWLMVRS